MSLSAPVRFSTAQHAVTAEGVLVPRIVVRFGFFVPSAFVGSCVRLEAVSQSIMFFLFSFFFFFGW